jgi:DNA-binding NarL/FixJ family response regulator
MRVLLLEDDYLQLDHLTAFLNDNISGLEIDICQTELEFHQKLDDIRRNPPDLAVFDVMVRWTNPSPKMVTPPEEIKVEGMYRAGLRCQQMLEKSPETARVPVILYTVLSDVDLEPNIKDKPPNVFYLQKDSPLDSLLRTIRSLFPDKLNAFRQERTVFLVHGHDNAAKTEVARFIEKLGLDLLILEEQVKEGRTVIEQIVEHANVSYAIVLLTADDEARPVGQNSELKPRARQNAVFELGYFIAKLGRERVCVLYREGVELPSDYSGVLYVKLASGGGWKLDVAKELKSAGLPVDIERIIE